MEQKQEIDIFDKPYPMLTTEGENGALNTTIHITREIGPAHDFIEAVSLMAAAEPQDTITFKFNTPGGCLDTTLMLLAAFENCKALLHGDVVGEVASAGTMLLMEMDSISVSKWGSIMIHNYSGGVYGKGHELQARMDFEKTHLPALFNDIYRPFLTKAECAHVLAGGDLYFNATEIMGKWELVNKKRQKMLSKKLQKEAQCQIEDGIIQSRKFLEEHDL